MMDWRPSGLDLTGAGVGGAVGGATIEPGLVFNC